MCGIAGYLTVPRQKSRAELQATVLKMADALRLRGPDDGGAWVDAEAGIALGHRRLSIIDLSLEGHQPMPSACGRYMVALNGEIYNYQDIRRELEQESQGSAVSWRGHSDTEVALAAISRWGIEAAVKRFVGMFAIALWDRAERVLSLVRDRMGEKPLYYGRMGRSILFGSELKALRTHPDFKGEIDRGALALYLRHNCIPAPYSIYQGIYKLPPGTMLAIPDSQAPFQDPVQYWSAREAAERGVAEPFSGSTEDAIAALDGVLRDAVRHQMVADVPLGAFLSGGIDSTTVVALMQAQSHRPVKTFTIGFNEAGYNEALHAKAVAAYLGTEHTELYVTPQEAMAVIPRLPALYDEPFADSSQIPTFLVSELARRSVTVSLSGDGGDELFAGYNRYSWGRSIWKALGWMPRPLRSALAAVLTRVPPQRWNQIVDTAGFLLPSKLKLRTPGDKIHKLAEIMAVESPEAMYHGLSSHWKNPASVVLGSCEPSTVITNRSLWADLPDFTQRMMYLDTVTYLPDDILVKVDRASMGVSLEGRIPFLDHRVVEFAWRLPLS
ncbi:MAG: asparagine synthase (glutamine-hydrolyzing), partial [Nitrospirae bacterium]